MFIFTKEFWMYAGERAIKTVAQTVVATITATEVVGILDVDWMQIGGVALLAGLASVLTSIGIHPKTETEEK